MHPEDASTADASSARAPLSMPTLQQPCYVWDGTYYTLAVTERLGLEGKGGMVRIGAVHDNTVEEVLRLGEALRGMTAQSLQS